MDVFVGGGGIGELVEQALLHPECRQVFRWGQSIGYIRPMVQRILEANQAGDRGQRIRAIVIYPMSALCNSQFKELEEEFCFGHPKGGERDSVANDTGQGKEAEREAIQTNPPDILLTNAARPAPGGRPPRRQMGALQIGRAHV